MYEGADILLKFEYPLCQLSKSLTIHCQKGSTREKTDECLSGRLCLTTVHNATAHSPLWHVYRAHCKTSLATITVATWLLGHIALRQMAGSGLTGRRESTDFLPLLLG
ncbi:hypothetical protein CDAR_544201 [Caerostris darwini]|uniref:Uncharacterized protein n=1 Tax=Caerostris darwini TaxID=1538125 RepID=A0AAV4TK40_9ARAC|nr:hypothetical protein CDAR_544201 [Caerostris darwini]